jgi:hypothetical protein
VRRFFKTARAGLDLRLLNERVGERSREIDPVWLRSMCGGVVVDRFVQSSESNKH